MTSDTYQAALQKAKAELIGAIQERDRLNLEIARLQQLVDSLQTTLDPSTKEARVAENVGFTELVLGLVNRSGVALTAGHIRQLFVLSGFDLKHYSNPLALIHQTLKRLAEQRKIRDLGNGTYKRHALYEALLNSEPKKLRPQERFKLEQTKEK